LRFYRETNPQHYPLIYEGEVNQTVIKAFVANIERDLIEAEEPQKVIRRVYHAIVESLQNMSRHADSWSTGKTAERSRGLLILKKTEEAYIVTTGNLIAKERLQSTMDRIQQVNDLDADGIKALYRERMREGKISERGGAGLGFIDLVKKTGNPIGIEHEHANDMVDFLLLSVRVNRS
jgi:hypothetical protein